jgi:hypothetical protein
VIYYIPAFKPFTADASYAIHPWVALWVGTVLPSRALNYWINTLEPIPLKKLSKKITKLNLKLII